ncbi:unnamed protein product, partial [Rotaria magnacalcarata]
MFQHFPSLMFLFRHFPPRSWGMPSTTKLPLSPQQIRSSENTFFSDRYV